MAVFRLNPFGRSGISGVLLVLMMSCFAGVPTNSGATDTAPVLSAPSVCAAGAPIEVQGAAFLEGGTIRVDITDPSGAVFAFLATVQLDGSFVLPFTPPVAGDYSFKASDGRGAVLATLLISATAP